MKNTKLKLLLSCFIASLLLVTLLYLFSYRTNRQLNGFIRVFKPHTIASIKTIDLKFNSYYIAGSTNSHVYLGNTTSPLSIIAVNTSLTDTEQLYINLDSTSWTRLKSANLEVDSPNFFLKDGVSPVIFSGNLSQLGSTPNEFTGAFFSESAVLSTNSFAIRTSRNHVLEYILAKEEKDPIKIKYTPGILQNQSDGFFSTDGMLTYNKQLSRLFYVYYYRNQFICMDSNLVTLYRGHTIDTNSQANVKVANINSNKTIMLASPPLKVNNRICTFQNLVFINSNLLANNESLETFKVASVIDVYRVHDGKYMFSFYVYDYAKKKIKSIAVNDKALIAIFDHYLVTCYLDSSVFR